MGFLFKILFKILLAILEEILEHILTRIIEANTKAIMVLLSLISIVIFIVFLINVNIFELFHILLISLPKIRFGGFLLIFIILIYTIISFVAIKRYLQAKNFHTWAYTDGEIVSSKLILASQAKSEIILRIKFKYIVENKEYISNRLDFCEHRYNKEEMDEIAKEFAVGQIVDVYFNPKKPEQSVLLLCNSPECIDKLLISIMWRGLGFLFFMTIFIIHLLDLSKT